MKNHTYIACLAGIALASASLTGMTAKMPDKQAWLQKNRFGTFVRELDLRQELAGKKYSEEQLTAAISICRTETHVGKTLAQRELAQKSPELGRKLFAALAGNSQ